jgi:hypothetical protein
MIQIELTDEECAMLREVLALNLQDLRHEIHHANNREFRALLRKREAFFDRFLSQLQPRETATA